MNHRILKNLNCLPQQSGRLALLPSGRTRISVRRAPKITPTQITIVHEKSVRFMKEIGQRAQAPFRSSAPGPIYQPEPVYPPILSRL